MMVQKGLKVYLLFALLVSSVLSSMVTLAKPASAAFVDIPPMEMVQQMVPGWNLGNTLDAIPTEGSWNNAPVTEADLDMVKNAGFKSIRIPVTWTDHTGSAPNFTVDPVWMNRVEQVVDWALARDLYVVLNVHHDSWQWAQYMPGDSNAFDRFKKIWTQISARFKDKSEKLSFEILNEPKQTSADMMTINDQVLPIIRTSGGYNDKRLVIVSGEATDPQKTIDSFTAPNDPNIAVTVHYYPYQFVSNSWNMPTWNTTQNKTDLHNLFQAIQTKFVNNNIPVILGEYGIMSEIVYLPEARYFMDNVNKEAREHGIQTMFWDDGWNSGFDRVTHTIKPDRYLNYVLSAANGSNNSFVWPGEFYIQAGAPVTDFTASLDLYGNTLTGVYNGSTQLASGTDYTVSGTTFTLKASYLNSILNASQLGKNATLTFKFSNGTDCLVDINRYTTPTVGPLTVDKSQPFTADWVIPFNYNGVKIKHIRAYENGTETPVDSVNWWSQYLEGNADYTYDNVSTLTFRKDFANMFDTNSTLSIDLWPSGTIEVPVTVTTGQVNNSTITPTTATFDKKTSAQADIPVTLTLNGNTFGGVKNSSINLVEGTDYTVSANTVTIKKSYMAAQNIGTTTLTFWFSAGASPTIAVNVVDTTAASNNAAITPTTATFDKKTSAQADIPVTLTLNGNTLSAIKNGTATLVSGTNYTVSGSTVTILKSYLAAQPLGTTTLTFDFSAGTDPNLAVNVIDTTTTTSGSLKVQMFNANTSGTSNTIYPRLKLVNTGTTAITLSDVKLRYYYTVDGQQAQNFFCDWSQAGCSNVTGTYVTMAAPKTGADTYLEVGFASGAGSLAAGQSIDIQVRMANNNWSNYTQTGDYSFNASSSSYADWNKVTAYLSGTLQWGTEP